MTTAPATILAALRDVAAAAETDDTAAFEDAAEQFLDTFHAARPPSLAEYDILPLLLGLETELARDPELSADYPVACATVRQWIAHQRGQQARLN